MKKIICTLLMLMIVCLVACNDSSVTVKDNVQNNNVQNNNVQNNNVQNNNFDNIPLVDSLDVQNKNAQNGNSSVLMIYMIGSDLETRAGAGTDDLEEIKNSGIDLSVSDVYIYAGGTPHWHNEVANGEFNNILKLTPNGFECIETLESRSMGEAETLTYFLDYVNRCTNAKEYSLIMWNHGAGPILGYGSDIVFDKDTLLLTEIDKAFEASSFNSDNKLSWIGFDACLMSSAELAYICSEYSDYLVASQEIEPAFGWNYSFLSLFGKSDTKEFLANLVDSYDKYCTEYYAKKGYDNTDITLSCIDLSYAKELEASLDSLFKKASEQMPYVYADMVQNRTETRDFGKATTGSDYDLVDLGDMSSNLAELYPKESAELSSVIDKMVLYNANHSEGCSGISIYYPYYNKYYYENGWSDTYAGINVFDAYKQYLDSYATSWLERDTSILGTMANIIAPTDKPGLYTLQLTDEQNESFASAKYYILEREGWGIYTPIYVSSDVSNNGGVLEANFDGKVIYAYNDDGSTFIPVVSENGTVGDYTHYLMGVNLATYFNFGQLIDDSLSDMQNIFDNLQDELNGVESVDEKAEESETKTSTATETEVIYCRMHFTYNQRTEEFKLSSFVENDSSDRAVMMRGKSEEIDVSQWHRYIFPGEEHYFLLRNSDGTIKPISQWINTGNYSHIELPVDKGLYFEYADIYDGRFYILIEVEDVYGNKISSELLPVESMKSIEPIPEEPKQISVNWSQGDKVKLLENNSVSLYMNIMSQTDLWTDETTYSYGFTAENNSGEAVDIIISDVVVNGNICTSEYESLLPKAGETAESWLGGMKFEEELEAGGIDAFRSISFNVEITENETGFEVVQDTNVCVNISDDARIPIGSFEKSCLLFDSPYLGARAEKQVLYESENLRVTLMGFGTAQASYTDRGYLCFENLSDEYICVSNCKFAINSISFATVGGKNIIPGGYKVYDYVYIDDDLMAECGISGINDLRFAIVVWQSDFIGGFGEVIWSDPVVFVQKSESEQSFTEGEDVLFDKDGIRVAVVGYEESSWIVSVVNESDKNISLELFNEYIDGVRGYIYCDEFTLGSGQSALGRVGKYENITESVKFNLAIMDFTNEEIYYYSEEPITLYIK